MRLVNREQTAARTGATLLALLVLLAVVALASRYPLGARTGAVGQGAGETITSVLAGLAGCAALIVGTLLVGLLRDTLRRGNPDEERDTTPRLRRWWTGPLAIAGLALCLGGAFTFEALRNVRKHALVSSPAGLPNGSSVRLPRVAPHASGLSTVAIAAAAGVVAVILLGWLLVGLADRRRLSRTFRAREAVRKAVASAHDDVDWSLDPRTAVLRAYGRMESVLGAHGLTRRSSEAPREYLARSLAEVAGAGSEVERLTGRFEEARYSTHTIDEAARDDARGALRDLGSRLTTHSETELQR